MSAAQPAAAPPAPPTGVQQSKRLAIEADQAQVIQLSEPAKTVFVANPDIADVQVPTPTSFLVYGKKAGTTTVFAISESGATTSYTVRVSRPVGEISGAVHAAVPGAKVRVISNPDGVTITGSVDSPRDAERLKSAARQYLGDKETINFDVAIDMATQITLRVQVAEVSRTVDKALGVNWSAIGNIGTIGRFPTFPALTLNGNNNTTAPTTNPGNPLNLGGSFGALITALDQQGLATILAEPSLTAISGETANFLAGGEFPIPVPQGNQVTTIEYKNFGVSLAFTPTVLDGNRISMMVRPEVSQLTTTGAITLNGVTVPALEVRRAETTVELASGESFAIAGLFQNNGQNDISGLPFLGNIPILGALFRSTDFKRNESELVIIVTPYIVRPADRPSDLHLPTERLEFSSDIERIPLGRLTATPTAASPGTPTTAPHLHGAAGFILE
ncbi:MAG TPA: type II and III secretion system protein family protein [Acetobacteraceae bacterium]